MPFPSVHIFDFSTSEPLSDLLTYSKRTRPVVLQNLQVQQSNVHQYILSLLVINFRDLQVACQNDRDGTKEQKDCKPHILLHFLPRHPVLTYACHWPVGLLLRYISFQSFP